MPQFVGDDGTGGVWMSWWLPSPADVDAAHEVAIKNGMTVTMPPTDEPWNVREFHLRHPDGQYISRECRTGRRLKGGSPDVLVRILESQLNLPQVVTLRLLLEKPTAGVDFGLQEGRGSSIKLFRNNDRMGVTSASNSK